MERFPYACKESSPLGLIEREFDISRRRALERHNEHVLVSWRRRKRRRWLRILLGYSIYVALLAGVLVAALSRWPI